MKLSEVIQRKWEHKDEEKLTCLQGKYEKSAMKLLYTNFSDTLTFRMLQFIAPLVRKCDLLIWNSLWWYLGHIVQSVTAGNTEERDSFFDVLDYYSGDSPFEYRLGHFLSGLRFLVGFHQFFRQSQK